MATFLTTRNIESALEDLIKKARRELLLVTPFIQTHQMVIERLTDAAERGVLISIVCREKDLKAAQKEQLTAIGNTTLWFMEHLHAKCYANEDRLILTSMNLYDASRKNREMGVLVEASQPAYTDAREEIASIIRSSTKYAPRKAQKTKTTPRPKAKPKAAPKAAPKAKPRPNKPASASAPKPGARGFCIRCSKGIKRNAKKPLCPTCYTFWVKTQNVNRPEKHCHSCGTQKAKVISFAKPECYSCWKA